VAAVAEGPLLVTAEPPHSQRIIAALRKEGIESSVIGKVSADTSMRVLHRQDGSTVPLATPAQDPFWPAFLKGLASAPGPV